MNHNSLLSAVLLIRFVFISHVTGGNNFDWLSTSAAAIFKLYLEAI